MDEEVYNPFDCPPSVAYTIWQGSFARFKAEPLSWDDIMACIMTFINEGVNKDILPFMLEMAREAREMELGRAEIIEQIRRANQ